ncbi:RdRP-domain-containing protein [Punctularia strigosozonata HHB-11173 SS5]|uniref:RNA-dependent RNA polymerase n=1 Tax=Punctularia strigosozonata (strain HHB-11173) TaxID=741275 RepID=R7S030_PUNST|nr:RdRP-domain-containing protein [Punctularia strigosozonata HHB-11173 SS5]EIN03593.1 RdRP-domain-containing protein [Punctularia strigosozonata HHB-11173 SS5]
MDIYMSGIAYAASADTLTQTLASILHSKRYARFSDGGILLNFQVNLFPDQRRAYAHGGAGILTIPSREVALQFLAEFGGKFPLRVVQAHGRYITFQQSKKALRQDIIEYCRRMPYQDPRQKAEQQQRRAELSDVVDIEAVQFGWECRDGAFSLEWERTYASCTLRFDDDTRRLRITGRRAPVDQLYLGTISSSPQHYVVRYAHILYLGISESDESLYFTLGAPPAFERDVTYYEDTDTFTASYHYQKNPVASQTRKPQGYLRRVSHFGGDHERVASYVSLAMRLKLGSSGALQQFRHMAGVAGLRTHDYTIAVERRNLFSEAILRELAEWLKTLRWMVAFHIEAIHRKLLLDPTEILQLRKDVDRIFRLRGVKYTSQLLRHFANGRARELGHDRSVNQRPMTAKKAFQMAAKEFKYNNATWLTDTADGLFDCLHVIVTPSSIVPQEQYPDRSNRVIRSFPDHQQHFVRVQFTEEDYHQLRFDRDVDGEHFVKTRIGGVLRNGFQVGGRTFEFLAYSQSALKDHAVWFVRRFKIDNQWITGNTIRESLGSFDKVIYCPSLYGARMSQAFTATDPSVTITAEEIVRIPDIERRDSTGRTWQFTDGVGTISPELAQEITTALVARSRRKKGRYFRPRAFQIRIAGSKGMVSVNHKLHGRVLCLRPSMIKFESPNSLDIEIAKTFDKPGKFLLNRPLVMLLEGLGVPADEFMKLQNAAVEDTKAASRSLTKAAQILETHGLGTAFRLTSVFLGLERLGVDLTRRGNRFRLEDEFIHRAIAYAINHVLRELKHHARIPVPSSWTLVGIADIHGVLKEGEVFACIQPSHGGEKIYLQGPVMITRSPVIHPGDVQMLRAVGRPPAGSIYDLEPIPNTVIFSIKGSRPTASELGGGDLDGDVFNVSQYFDIFPKKCYMPASYATAERKMLDRPSDVGDVIDFVVDFINNDNLGLIATNWLIIADQSPESIFDDACLQLQPW